jgi:hypothetical protein
VSLADIRKGLKIVLERVPGVGVVTDFEPWAVREEDFRAFFGDPIREYVLGWTITRQATEELEDTTQTPRNIADHLMVIRGYRAVAQAGATERQFQDLIEEVRAALRHEQLAGEHLGGVCRSLGPPHVQAIEHRTFSDFLVHYAELHVRCRETVTL